MSLKESLATLNQRTSKIPFPVPFSFPAKLHIVCITNATDPNFVKCMFELPTKVSYLHFAFPAKPLYQRLIDLSGYDGSILVPDNLQNELGVTSLFQKLAEDMYTLFKGTLKCGNLESKVILSPAPVVHVLLYLVVCVIYVYVKIVHKTMCFHFYI